MNDGILENMSVRDRLAIYMAKESNAYDAKDRETQVKYYKLSGKLKKEYDKDAPDNFNYLLGGYNEAEESHYEIQDAVKEVFGDRIVYDSESGQLVLLTKKETLEELKKFLKSNYPSLNFDYHNNQECEYPTNFIVGLANWNQALKYVKKHNLQTYVNDQQELGLV